MLLSRTMNTDCVTAAEDERSMPGLADDRVGAFLAVDGASQLKVGQLCWAKVVGVVIGTAPLLSLISTKRRTRPTKLFTQSPPDQDILRSTKGTSLSRRLFCRLSIPRWTPSSRVQVLVQGRTRPRPSSTALTTTSSFPPPSAADTCSSNS